MVFIVMTGANGDVGMEVCKQAAFLPEVTKILLTTRSKEKGEATIKSLMEATGKEESFFDHVILDLMDYNSIINAADELPSKIDRLCLNAGGTGQNKKHAQSGAVDCMVMNTIGHALLTDELFKKGKIPDSSRVVYVGSEVSRPLYSFIGLLPNYAKVCCGKFGENEIDWAIEKNYGESGLCGCIPIRAQLGDYKNAKIVGSMFFSHMAKEHPGVHFMTISPGAIAPDKSGTGTGFTKKALPPVNILMKCCPGIFKCIQVAHDLESGSSRYLDGVLTGEKKWDNGAVVLSGRGYCGFNMCYWTAKGAVMDNRPSDPYFSDEALCEKAAIKVREWEAKWETNVSKSVATSGSIMER